MGKAAKAWRNGFPSPPRVSFPKGDVRFAQRGPGRFRRRQKHYGGQWREAGRRGFNGKYYIVQLLLDSAMECARLAGDANRR